MNFLKNIKEKSTSKQIKREKMEKNVIKQKM